MFLIIGISFLYLLYWYEKNVYKDFSKKYRDLLSKSIYWGEKDTGLLLFILLIIFILLLMLFSFFLIIFFLIFIILLFIFPLLLFKFDKNYIKKILLFSVILIIISFLVLSLPLDSKISPINQTRDYIGENYIDSYKNYYTEETVSTRNYEGDEEETEIDVKHIKTNNETLTFILIYLFPIFYYLIIYLFLFISLNLHMLLFKKYLRKEKEKKGVTYELNTKDDIKEKFEDTEDEEVLEIKKEQNKIEKNIVFGENHNKVYNNKKRNK